MVNYGHGIKQLNKPLRGLYEPYKSLPYVPDFSETFSHDVDVVDVEEDKLHVLVQILVLVAAPGGHVGHRVHLRPCVHDEDAVRLRVGIHDLRRKTFGHQLKTNRR